MKLLRFNWQAYDPVGGMKYAAGVAVIIALSMVFPDFPWFATGASAVLAWLPATIPGRRSDRLLSVLIFIVLAAALVGLANLLSGTHWPWFVAMLAVAFLGTFMMIKGMRGFMTGWCLICWFYVAPLVGALDAPGQLLICHLFGSGVVFGLIALPLLWEKKQPDADEGSGTAEETDPPPSLGFVLQHSTAVGLVMAIGLFLGVAWLKSDPTMITNASLMVMFPSRKQTVSMAADRMIGAMLGIIVGFYLALYIQSPILEPLLWIVMSYGVFALMYVNAGACAFFFLVIMSAGWGAMDYEVGNAIANERIFAELVGVSLAGIGVTVRSFFGSDA
jgi:uncharacterized membrane protein YccC